MRKTPKADPKLLEYLPERDMLVVQRRCLLDDHEEKRRKRRQARRSKLPGSTTATPTPDQAPSPAATAWLRRKDAASTTSERPEAKPETPAPAKPVASESVPASHPTKEDPKLPPLLYSFDVIYRYTRGTNDISNPGMGYGELTRETRWAKQGTGLSPVNLVLRRTRTGRQEVVLTPDKKPTR